MFPKVDVTSDKFEPVPAARFKAGVIISAACAALNPCLAKFSVASAASCIEYTEFAAAVFNASDSFDASSFVLPIVACTSLSCLSTEPKF